MKSNDNSKKVFDTFLEALDGVFNFHNAMDSLLENPDYNVSEGYYVFYTSLEIAYQELMEVGALEAQEKVEITRHIQGLALTTENASVLYTVANYAMEFNEPELANESFSAAHKFCAKKSQGTMNMFSVQGGYLNIDSIEKLDAAILCNWAAIPRDGLLGEVNLDQAIASYDASAEMGMTVSRFNASNIRKHKLMNEGFNKELFERCISDYAKVVEVFDKKAPCLDFNETNEHLSYRAAEQFYELVQEFFSEQDLSKPCETNNLILELSKKVYTGVANLYENGLYAGSNSQVNYDSPERSMYCCGNLLSRLFSLIITPASKTFIKTHKKPDHESQKKFEDFLSKGDNFIMAGLPNEEFHIKKEVSEGLLKLSSGYDPIELWVFILKELGWNIIKNNNLTYQIKINGDDWELVTAPEPDIISFQNEIMESLPEISTLSNVIVLPSIGHFFSPSSQNEPHETYFPALIATEEKYKVVSLGSLHKPDILLEQFNDGSVVFGGNPEYSTLYQAHIVAFNEMLFGSEYNSEKQVSFVGNVRTVAIPIPNAECLLIAETILQSDIPILNDSRKYLIGSSGVMISIAAHLSLLFKNPYWEKYPLIIAEDFVSFPSKSLNKKISKIFKQTVFE